MRRSILYRCLPFLQAIGDIIIFKKKAIGNIQLRITCLGVQGSYARCFQQLTLNSFIIHLSVKTSKNSEKAIRRKIPFLLNICETHYFWAKFPRKELITFNIL